MKEREALRKILKLHYREKKRTADFWNKKFTKCNCEVCQIAREVLKED